MIIKHNNEEVEFSPEERTLIKELIKSSFQFLNDVDDVFEKVPWEDFGVTEPSEDVKIAIEKKLEKIGLF